MEWWRAVCEMCILYLLPDSLALAGGDGVALHKARLPGVQEGNNAVVSARLIAPVEQERVVQQREVLAAVARSRVKQKGRAVCVRYAVPGKLDARRGILEVDAAAVGTARDLALFAISLCVSTTVASASPTMMSVVPRGKRTVGRSSRKTFASTRVLRVKAKKAAL